MSCRKPRERDTPPASAVEAPSGSDAAARLVKTLLSQALLQAPRGQGATYERAKRNNLPTVTFIDDRRSGPSTYQAGPAVRRGAHQADDGRTDPSDVPAFLGRLGTNALAGASLAFPFVMLSLQATNSGMGNGVSSAIARALGAGKRDRADALVCHAVLLALGLGAIFAGAILFGGPSLFRGMGGQDDMLAAALAYANVALGGAICICLLNFLANAVRGTGNMTLPASVLAG